LPPSSPPLDTEIILMRSGSIIFVFLSLGIPQHARRRESGPRSLLLLYQFQKAAFDEVHLCFSGFLFASFSPSPIDYDTDLSARQRSQASIAFFPPSSLSFVVFRSFCPGFFCFVRDALFFISEIRPRSRMLDDGASSSCRFPFSSFL